MRNKEYDSFGPWIYEISDDYPMPNQFKQYITSSELPLLSIKIPRNIERRKARPGMPLYDYVVNLYEKSILILKREGDSVISNSYIYDKIECLQNRINLLNGNLRIIMSDIVYNLPYNAVSEKIILHMVELIRQRYTNIARYLLTKDSIVDISKIKLSFYFNGLLNNEKIRNPEFKVIASQEESSISLFETGGFLIKLQHRILGKRLLESLHLSDGRELLILGRGISYKRRNQAVYGKETLFVPINKITDVVLDDDIGNSAISNMTLKTSNNSYHVAFLQKNWTLPSFLQFLKEARSSLIEST